MQEPIITCPKCSGEIRLSESLAAPLIESTKREYEARLSKRNAEIADRERALQEREASLAKAKETADAEITEKLKAERAKIAADAAKTARLELGDEIEQRKKDFAELERVLKVRDQKLAEAQQAQASILKKERHLADQTRELELTIEKGIKAELERTRQSARKEAEDEMQRRVAEKEQTITSMQRQIEDLKRKAEQGSQQTQGEAQELELERLLRAKFVHDTITPVPKGQFGGDALQKVISPLGQVCGTILWESKNTKNWSAGWLTKLRDDQRTAKAELAVLVTQALPEGVESFDLIDGVWVAHVKHALPVALALRQSLVELAIARQASEGQQTKMGQLYSYLTGPRFRQRVQAIVEGFSTMKEDLDKERKAISKHWAKRDEQIERVMQATVGMYGDMQGIAGAPLQEIEGLDLKNLEAASDPSSS